MEAARWQPLGISCSRLSTMGDYSPTPPTRAKSFSKSRRDKQVWGRPSRTNSTANSTSPLWVGQARPAGVEDLLPLHGCTRLCWMERHQCLNAYRGAVSVKTEN